MALKHITVNALGDACPIPVVKTLKALEELAGAGEVETLVDNKVAVENLSRMAASHGLETLVEQAGPKEWRVVTVCLGAVEGGALPKTIDCEVPVPPEVAPVAEASPAPVAASAGAVRNVVVQVSSDTMGEGDEVLGKKLMQGFIFSLTQLDELPQTMLFYNGGARLTCTGSPVLDDLRGLAEAGVEVLTCGTCLDHYGITDALGVGEVTNMYVIVQKLTGASVVVRP